MKKFNHFGEVISYRAEKTPDDIAVEFLSNDKKLYSVTYKDLHEQAQSVAHQLLALAKPEERVLLIYPPSLEFLYAFLGCLYAGIVAVPLPVPLKGTGLDERLGLVIESAKPDFVLTTRSIARLIRINKFLNRYVHYSIVKKLQDKLQSLTPLSYQNLTFNIPVKSLIANYLKKLPLGYTPNRSAIAFLQYTSGSTNAPRGVVITHGNLLDNLEVIHIESKANSSVRMLSWLPHFHDMGLILGLLQPLYSGYRVRFFSPELFIKEPLLWLQQIDEFKATISGGPTFAFAMILKSLELSKQSMSFDLSSWTQVFCGAEIIDVEILLAFYEKLSVYGLKKDTFIPCYGLAESVVYVVGINRIDISSYLTINSDFMVSKKIKILDKYDENGIKIITCGKNYNDQLLLIVDENSAVLPDLSIGNVVIHSPSVTPGYWDPVHGDEDIFHYKVKTFDQTFLDTGDLGFLHEGLLYIVGRAKEVIKIHGENYFPVWIESCVKSEVKELFYDTVLALQWMDELHETLCILVILKNKKTHYKDVAKAIFSSVLKKYHIRVSQIFFVKKGIFHKTSSGKWPRRLIALTLHNHNNDLLYRWKDNVFQLNPFNKAQFDAMDTTDKKVRLVMEYLKDMTRVMTQHMDDVDENTQVREVLTDSMTIYQFFIELQQTFDIDWDDIIYNERLTYKQLASFLVSQVEG